MSMSTEPEAVLFSADGFFIDQFFSPVGAFR